MYTWKIGEGVTLRYVSDCYPFTIVKISPSGRKIVIQEDRANRVSGSWPDYQYEYIRDGYGRKMIFTFRKNGAWRQQGDDMRHTGARISPGRRFYQDPSY